MNLLEIKNLSVRFHTDEKIVNAVDDLSICIEHGKTVCIVGESGCGKSVTSLAVMRLLQEPQAEITGGQIHYKGTDLHSLSIDQMRTIRGSNIAMIFQDPMTSLNPTFTCGFQIAEALMYHKKMDRTAAYKKTIELFKQVHIPDAEKRVYNYPHQLSGGMRQRVMIAMALSCDPELLIADEPTTALDVTVQAQILDLLEEIKEKRTMSILFITHDLGIVAEIADVVVVLYAGKVAERGLVEEIYENPRHPYTIGLLDSIPNLERKDRALHVIPGTLPDPTAYSQGCRFYDRCPLKSDICKKNPPETSISPTHSVACFHYADSKRTKQ